MFKKLLALMLSVMMLLSVAACSSSGSEESADETEKNAALQNAAPEAKDSDIVFIGDAADGLKIGTPAKTLNAQAVYDKLTYGPEFFWGDYRLRGGDAADEQFGKDHSYAISEFGGEENNLTVVPMGFVAGNHTMSYAVNTIDGYNWCLVYFMRQASDGEIYLDYFVSTYTVEGNELKVRPLDYYEYEQDTNKITFAVSETVEWVYEFSFCGRKLTLSANGESVTLESGLEPYRAYDWIGVDNYLTEGSDRIDIFDAIDMLYDPEGGYNRIYLENDEDFITVDECIAVMSEDGLFTCTYVDPEGVTKTFQYVYFYCADDGIIFTDGTNTYYYNYDYSDKYMNYMNSYLTEDQTGKLEELTETELEEIAEKTEDLMGDLEAAFNDAGIEVTVDPKTGEMIMKASVLFDGDSAVLKDAGKNLLNKFVAVYTDIIYSDKYDGFIKETLIEGHTAPVGNSSYEDGYPLSLERAEVVFDYCVSDKTGVDTTELAKALKAVGCSNAQPVKDADGNVNMEASRRVSFRFIVNID